MACGGRLGPRATSPSDAPDRTRPSNRRLTPGYTSASSPASRARAVPELRANPRHPPEDASQMHAVSYADAATNLPLKSAHTTSRSLALRDRSIADRDDSAAEPAPLKPPAAPPHISRARKPPSTHRAP